MWLGPLGRLREIVSFPDREVEVETASSSWMTLGARRVRSSAPRAPRAWEQSWIAVPPAEVAYLEACAARAIAGPIYLYLGAAAEANLLPADVAAPCSAGTTALGAVAGLVAVGMPSGVETLTGVAQQAAVGAWSSTLPLRGTVALTLSAWASAAGAAVTWRTVNASGAQVATGTVTAAAVTGGFRGAVSITPGATSVGLQLRIPAGPLVVGGLRLTEGAHVPVWLPGEGVPQVAVVHGSSTHRSYSDRSLADHTYRLEEVG